MPLGVTIQSNLRCDAVCKSLSHSLGLLFPFCSSSPTPAFTPTAANSRWSLSGREALGGGRCPSNPWSHGLCCVSHPAWPLAFVFMLFPVAMSEAGASSGWFLGWDKTMMTACWVIGRLHGSPCSESSLPTPSAAAKALPGLPWRGLGNDSGSLTVHCSQEDRET